MGTRGGGVCLWLEMFSLPPLLGSLLRAGFFLVVVSQGLFSSCGVQVSHCGGFS